MLREKGSDSYVHRPSPAALPGHPLWRISKKFNFAAEKIIPDSFVFCVILMLAVFVLSLVLCGKSPWIC